MFPQDTIDDVINSFEKENPLTQESFLKSYGFDFEKKDFEVKDGSPCLVDDIEATKQWIIKFLNTDIDTLEIYNGYKFGTSVRKLFGQKYLNNGFAESELERQVREGFILCPSINKVTSFKAEKENQYLKIKISVLLNNGNTTTVAESINI